MIYKTEDAKNYIKEHAKDYLEPDGTGAGYICPICGSGSGNKGTGITTKDGEHFTCWAGGCFSNADIIDIIGVAYNLTSYPEKLKQACAEFGIELAQKQTKSEQYTHNTHNTDNTDNKHKEVNKAMTNPITNTEAKTQKDTKETKDHTSFFDKAHEHLTDCNYMTAKRGISEAILNRFNIGYFKGFNVSKTESWDAIIIPTGISSFNIRNTNPEAPKESRYRKHGKTQLFNKEALNQNKPVFIVEGEIEAMSIIEAGGEALGLGSCSNYKQLTNYMKDNNLTTTLILALDDDTAGEKNTEKLQKELEELNIPYIETCLSGAEGGDANDLLIKDKDQLIYKIREAEKEAIANRDKELIIAKEEYEKNSTSHYIKDFLDGIRERANTSYIPTGFKALDNELDGGLFEGLYFIGAISSLGKTTFTLQIADQIAKAGQDVLIFSLEMARSELMSKSISRETLLNTKDIKNAKSTRGITTYKRYDNYSPTERELINKSVLAYKEYAKHLYIIEGVGDVDAVKIRKAVENHINLTGNKPVVIIDYIQIIAPANIGATDKQNTDLAVLELKRISRDCKLPIIGISSFNRDNYTAKVSMQAFKESGAIEYSSDVLIGLQFKGQGEKDFDIDKAKAMGNSADTPRDIELVILKNRNGRTGGRICYDYFSMFNYFRERGY